MPELVETRLSSEELVRKLSEIDRYFRGTKYDPLVKEANSLFYQARYEDLEEMLNRFPTKDQMLVELVEKLKGKSIYTTLKKICNEKTENDWTKFKGLSSLLTHIAIEAERGNTEYKYLLVEVYERIGGMLAYL